MVASPGNVKKQTAVHKRTAVLSFPPSRLFAVDDSGAQLNLEPNFYGCSSAQDAFPRVLLHQLTALLARVSF